MRSLIERLIAYLSYRRVKRAEASQYAKLNDVLRRRQLTSERKLQRMK